MFLTKKHLSRRTLLKGAGIGLALPLLDAMIPAATALGQTAAARRLRMGFFYLPHGAIMNNTTFGPQLDRWTPSGSGANFKLNSITYPLEPYKKYVTSIGNLKNDAVLQGPQHTLNPATWLSGMKPDLPGPKMCATLDQVVASEFDKNTLFPSLLVASEMTMPVASGPYTTLSFRDATTPLDMEFNPRKVFAKLFHDENDEPRSPQSVKENLSLLDLIKDQTQELQRELGPRDRAVLDSYLTSVREVEQKVERRTQFLVNQELLPQAPKGVLAFDEQVDMMFDLITIAYRADLTRVVSFLMAAERTNQTYDHIGVPDSFHPLSHHANDIERINKLVKIQSWHMERFADFLRRLAAVPDGDGTLLDNSLFLYGSNMSNSDLHNAFPLPTLLVGGGAGKFSGGRHLDLAQPTPIANLHLTLLQKLGIEQKTFGDSTGTISEL